MSIKNRTSWESFWIIEPTEWFQEGSFLYNQPADRGEQMNNLPCL